MSYEWTQTTVDEILRYGDSMYLHALQKGEIPDAATSLVSDLPNVATSIDDSQWTIFYDRCIEGFVNDPLRDILIPNFQILSSALTDTFQKTNSAILVLDGYMSALIKDTDCFALFDSHARTRQGMPCSDGSATVSTFSMLAALKEHVQSLSACLNVNRFEIVPVSLKQQGDSSLSSKEKKQQANRKQYLKRKLHESDAEKYERLSKAAKYKKDNRTKIHSVKKENYKRTKSKQTRKRSIHEANQDASKTTF